MGIKRWAGLVLLAAVGMVACKPSDGSRSFRQAVEKADTLWAYQVEGYPTAASAQRKDVRYVFGYEVKKVHPLLAPEVATMKAVLLDTATFDTSAVKSCPTVAQYAIAVRKNGKTPVGVVISPAPCGKAILFDQQQPEKPVYMELREGNKLEAALAGMW